MLKRTLALTLLLLGLCTSALSSTSTLTGTIKDSQGNPVTGTLTMALPVPAQDVSSGTLITVAPVRYTLSYGVIQAGPPLFDVVGLQPGNLYYVARVTDQANNLVMWGNFVVTGGTFNIGLATPTSITTSNISYLQPAGLNVANVWLQPQTFPAVLSGSGNIASTGFLRLANTDTINWRNGANSADLPLSVTPANNLLFASNNVGGAQACPGGQFLSAINPVLTGGGTCAAPAVVQTSTTISVTNQNPTGTVLNQLVSLSGAPSTALNAPIGATNVVGICTANCSASGTATITTAGITPCVFDGATTAGHFVTLSLSAAGNCTDAGTNPILKSYGMVLTTNVGAGTYNVALNVVAQWSTQILVNNAGGSCSGDQVVCQFTLSWPKTWTDAAYIAVCNGTGATPTSGAQSISWGGISSQTASTINVTIVSNGSTGGSFAGFNCIGVHP